MVKIKGVEGRGWWEVRALENEIVDRRCTKMALTLAVYGLTHTSKTPVVLFSSLPSFRG